MIKITNDTTTLNGSLQELGETIADNLVAMGVTGADASDGLTTLAGKILDIEPSVGGLDLDTEIELTTSSASIQLGQSVVLTAKLIASYDDETLVNVDLHGVLQGATISFKSGNAVLDTAVTDVNGVASYTYTPSSAGTLSLTAVFSGTDNFSSATSSAVSVSVTAPTVASVSLTSDKSILSYYNSESATLSATVLDSSNNPVENETVEFFKGSTSLGTASTNSNGVATKSYASTGSGDVSFTAECSSITSSSVTIEDCFYWNPTGLSYTSNSSTDRKVLTGLEDTLEFTPNGNFEFSYTEADTGVGKRLYLISKPQSTSTSNNYGIGGDIDSNSVAVTLRTTTSNRKSNTSKVSPSSFKFIIDGTNTSGYIDGTLKNTWTNVNWWSTYAPYTLSYAIWGTGTGTWTNIKIKRL